MAGTPTMKLRIFTDEPAACDPFQAEAAERLYHREAFRKPQRGSDLEPFSQGWFASIEALRYARQGHWIPRSLEFHRHNGDTVLCLGEGLGTDWLQYAANGANVVTLSPSLEQQDLVRTHFEQRGQSARHLYGPPHATRLASNSVDVVCLQGMLHEVDEPSRVVDEVYRVLRPGGKAIIVAPAKFNASFWYNASYPWRHWLGRPRGEQLPAASTGRELKKAFGRFVEHRVSKRHLRRSEMPHLWRWLPLSAMERVVGNLLVMKSFKPVSAVLEMRRAA